MFSINPNYDKLPGSYLFAEVARRVSAYQQQNPQAELVRLGIGDVTRPLAPAVIEAMHKAVDEMGRAESFRGYGPYEGYDFLIEAIRQNDYAAHGVDIGADEIFVSDGAKSDVANLQELFAADTRVAVTDPVYPVYVDSNALAGRLGDFAGERWQNLVYLPCTAENGFVPELPREDVDVIYFCFPNNPTGTTLSKAQLKPFVDWAREHGAIIVYDAAYKEFITSGAPRSIYEVEGAREVAIECGSYSKTAGFTGTRCGWCVIPHGVKGRTRGGEMRELNPLWARRIATKFNGVSYVVQRAAEAIYSPAGAAQCRENIAIFLSTPADLRDGQVKGGYPVFGGVDAPYIWLKTPGGMPSWDFFDHLLKDKHVVGTPGAGFGPSGEGYLRLTAFNTYEKTLEAVKRITE